MACPCTCNINCGATNEPSLLPTQSPIATFPTSHPALSPTAHPVSLPPTFNPSESLAKNDSSQRTAGGQPRASIPPPGNSNASDQRATMLLKLSASLAAAACFAFIIGYVAIAVFRDKEHSSEERRGPREEIDRTASGSAKTSGARSVRPAKVKDTH